MRVSILMPTLWPALARRAIASLRNHGAGALIEVEYVIVAAPEALEELDAPDVVPVVDTERAGVNAALRAGIAHCTGDLVHVTCDDVIHQPGWLDRVLTSFQRAELSRVTPFVMGVRHAGGIGTCWGHMYPNFPLFRRSLLDDPYLREHFMPAWLRGQWGDVAFGLAAWHSGAMVIDSGTGPQIAWADRGGIPEASTKGVSNGADMLAIVERFGPVFGAGWGEGFRDFNVDCPPAMLRDGTIRVPRAASFRDQLRRALSANAEFRV